MEYVLIGKIVSTHGIKGEVKLKSNFEFKDKVFLPNMNIYIGSNKIKEVIVSYRRHKDFDMICLDNYNNINEVLRYIGEDVYASREDLNLSSKEVLDSDLIGVSVYACDKCLGIIKDVFPSSSIQKVIRITCDKGEFLVPYVKEFVKNVDLSNKKMVLYSMEGVMKCE